MVYSLSLMDLMWMVTVKQSGSLFLRNYKLLNMNLQLSLFDADDDPHKSTGKKIWQPYGG